MRFHSISDTYRALDIMVSERLTEEIDFMRGSMQKPSGFLFSWAGGQEMVLKKIAIDFQKLNFQKYKKSPL